MSPVQQVLERLEGVRSVGPGRWIARCPAHDDRRPSLSIREGDDSRVLLWDFGGCETGDVLQVLDLDWTDLFPKRIEEWRGSEPDKIPKISARDALECLDEEALTVQIVAHRLAQGEPVGRHRKDLELAATRIATICKGWMQAS